MIARATSRSFSFLNEEDYETERTVSDYLNWVDKTAAQFARTNALRNSARLGDGLAKEFFDEVWPLHWYIKKLHRHFEDSTVQHFLGNRSFDACIRRYRNAAPCVEVYVEVTAPRDGQEEHFRMRYLAEHGRVSAWGPISGRRGANGRLVVYEIPEARSREELINEAYQWVEIGLRDKFRRLRAGKYKADMLLIVMVDDVGISRFQDGLRGLPEMIDRVHKLVGTRFKGIAVIGTAGRLYFDDTDKLSLGGAGT